MDDQISKKQFSALRLYNRGYTRRQAAEILGVAENTYAWHLKRIRMVFNISSRLEMLKLEEQLSVSE